MTGRNTPRAPRFRLGMGHVASGLLLLMFLLYALARAFEPAHPAFGFLRAFAEAAVVGALADWFAVTALFRRPLGLPLRHTEIIPRNKDRIGVALGRFVEHNFLSPEVVAGRIAALDFGGMLGRWLAEPDHAALVAQRVASSLPPVLEAVDSEVVRHFIRDSVLSRLRQFEVAPLTGEILGLLTAEGRHQPLVDAVLREAVAMLKEHEPEIRERVRANTAWLWQKLSMDERISDRILSVAEDTLLEISADHAHPWRQRLDRAVMDFAAALRVSEVYRARGEAIKERLLQHPALQDYLAGLWGEIQRAIVDDVRSERSAIQARLLELARLVAEGLERDEALRVQLNAWVRAAIVTLVNSQRHEVAELIAGTVRQWDGRTMAQKIESQIGDDLQYIRINGTLIGGLVGLLLHGLSVWAF